MVKIVFSTNGIIFPYKEWRVRSWLKKILNGTISTNIKSVSALGIARGQVWYRAAMPPPMPL